MLTLDLTNAPQWCDLMGAALALGTALGISPPAIAELLPALEAVMVRRVNEQIAASRD